MTLFAFLLPWFVAHGREMPPTHALVVALLASCGAAFLILVVVKGFGVAKLRLVTTGVLLVLCCSCMGLARSSAFPTLDKTKKVIHCLRRCLLARPLPSGWPAPRRR